ncbi:amino acid permease, partial [Bacillus cereus group sp. Bce025]
MPQYGKTSNFMLSTTKVRKTMAQVNNTNNELKRTMKSRHLFMIALGGVIGTGLFNGSGFIISQAGP